MNQMVWNFQNETFQFWIVSSVPRCFEIDAIIIHSIIIDHVICRIVAKMAFVVNVISDLLKISAINSNMHAVQPERQKTIVRVSFYQIMIVLHTTHHHSDANFQSCLNFMDDIANTNAKNVWWQAGPWFVIQTIKKT